MPELPEVETVARTLAPQIVGKKLTSVVVCNEKSLQAGHERLDSLLGLCVRSVSRRAKLLLVTLSAPEYHAGGAVNGQNRDYSGETVYLVFHLKMTGRFFVHPAGTTPLVHTRLIFDLADCESCSLVDQRNADITGSVRLFFDDIRKFGYCRIMRSDEFALWPFWKGLGPEPLETSASDLAMRMQKYRGNIKSVLLDQRAIAGVGNIYADESLFRAGIHPGASAASLTYEQLVTLAHALQDVLTQSISECGSSIRDYRDANGNVGAFQNSFAVYGKKGHPCTRCGTILHNARFAGRGTVYCPQCQPQQLCGC